MNHSMTKANEKLALRSKRYDRPMTRDQLADAILIAMFERWVEYKEESCPHCLRANQLPHTDWCLWGRWLIGGEITNDGD